MVKEKSIFSCSQCGAQANKWSGQCLQCQAWNSIVEESVVVLPAGKQQRFAGYAGAQNNKVTRLANVEVSQERRVSSRLSELDRVLGGGLVPGSVVLIGGDPGIGKSTLILQTLAILSQDHPVLYITGEESLSQVTMSARRLGLAADNLLLLAETHIEKILSIARQEKPLVMAIDSIQTMYTDVLSSAPGSVSQVRESAAQLVQFAKQMGIAVFLIGHVTKDGVIAGPRVLEHMVDTVLYFEGQSDSRFRVIRAIKNRFGAMNELGVFAMTDKGLREISNPSAIFLSRSIKEVPGSVVMVMWEGSRPLLVEVQALVNESHLGNPRRVTLGLEQNRLAMLLAVLHRHGGVPTYNQDVFVNVVGGVRITETAADLAVVAAVLSSFKDRAMANDWVVFGEIGLAGEIRPVQSGQERLREAAKHGYKRAIVPYGNLGKKIPPELEVFAVKDLPEAISYML